QAAVEQVRGDVLDAPGRADGRAVPVLGRERAEQVEQVAVQLPEQRRDEDRPGCAHRPPPYRWPSPTEVGLRPTRIAVGKAKWISPPSRWAPPPSRSRPRSAAKRRRISSAAPGSGNEAARSRPNSMSSP